MGRRTTRKARRKEVTRPSTFFIIALIVGLILLVVIAVMIIRHPPKQSEPLGRTGISPDAVARLARPSPTAAPLLVQRQPPSPAAGRGATG